LCDNKCFCDIEQFIVGLFHIATCSSFFSIYAVLSSVLVYL
jgi:hypothetical protein